MNTMNTPTDLYRHFDSNGTLLYIGISLSTLNRLGQHKDNSHWFNSISNITIEKFNTREEALLAEKDSIINEKPYYNTIHNVLKTFIVSYRNDDGDYMEEGVEALSKSHAKDVFLDTIDNIVRCIVGVRIGTQFIDMEGNLGYV